MVLSVLLPHQEPQVTSEINPEIVIWRELQRVSLRPELVGPFRWRHRRFDRFWLSEHHAQEAVRLHGGGKSVVASEAYLDHHARFTITGSRVRPPEKS